MAVEELSDTRMSCPRTLCVFSFTTVLNHGTVLSFGSETQMQRKDDHSSPEILQS